MKDQPSVEPENTQGFHLLPFVSSPEDKEDKEDKENQETVLPSGIFEQNILFHLLISDNQTLSNSFPLQLHENHHSAWSRQKHSLLNVAEEGTTRYKWLGVSRAKLMDEASSCASQISLALDSYTKNIYFSRPERKPLTDPFHEPSPELRESMDNLCRSIVSSFYSDDIMNMSLQMVVKKSTPFQRHHLHRAIVRSASRSFLPHAGFENRVTSFSVFAFPSYGRIDEASFNLQQISPARLREIAEMTGCLHDASDAFVLPAPLRTSSLSSPSFLKGLCDLAVDAPLIEEVYPEHSDQIISERVSRLARPFLATRGTGDFVFVGVRSVTSARESVSSFSDLSFDWYQGNSVAQSMARGMWPVMMRSLLSQNSIPRGTFMVRPPVPVMVAQAQAAAWNAVHEVYMRLHGKMCRYLSLVELPCGGARLEARADPNSAATLASSEIVPSSIYSLCPLAFQDLVREEHMLYRPRSLDRDFER